MGVYVIYYHRIFPDEPASDTTLPLFEWEMLYLKKKYQVLTLQEFLDYINGNLLLDRPGVCITFDDGWFDNFVYAYPILKRYGLKATIFVSTGKIRVDNGVRQTLEDCWGGRISLDNLQKIKGVEGSQEFLTWEEIRIMHRSGVMDIQSHGVTHKKIFSGDEIQGFNNGHTDWASKSITKDTRAGVPIYPLRSALADRAYYPDPVLNDHIASYVAKRSMPSEKELMEEVGRFKGLNPQGSGTWETEEEMRMRILGEIAESRDKIASEIGIVPVHLCWPWGQYIEMGIDLAKKAGYQACYTTKSGSVTKGSDKYRIPRVSTKGGKLTFVKRGLIYTHPVVSKIYLSLTRRY